MGLQLEMTADKERFRRSKPVVVTVALRNAGDETLEVNGRLLVNHDHAPEEVRDLSFEIEGPPGYTNTNAFRVNAGQPSERDVVTLAPGEERRVSVELTRFFSLHEPGSYTVTARYVSAVPIAGHDVWQGSLASQPLRLERR